MTVPTLQQLTKRAQFLHVRHGARAVRRAVLVEARRREEAGSIGVGFTASGKIGNAVIRNRAKRRLREAARKLLPELGLPGVDYVLVARQDTPSAAWSALLDDVRNALIRLRADLTATSEAPRDQRSTRRKTSTESQ